MQDGLFIPLYMGESGGEDREAETLTHVPKLSIQAAEQQSHPHPTGTSGCNSYVNNLTVGFMGFFLSVVA